MSFDGNLSKNFKRLKQQLEIYLIASDKDQDVDKVKVAILLNLIGEQEIDIFNTLKLDEQQKAGYVTVLTVRNIFHTKEKY